MAAKIKEKENVINSHLFLVMLCLIFIVGMYGLVKEPKMTSVSENRKLNQFSHFTMDDFIDGSFQGDFENAISDQFIFSEKIRVGYRELIAKLPMFGADYAVCKQKYLEVINSSDEKRATFDCDDYLVYVPKTKTAEFDTVFYDNVAKYNHLNSLTDAYYYVINDSYDTDFEKNNRSIDFASLLKESLSGVFHIAELKFNTYDEYKKLFFKTDHHWNYLGSRQGFVDIAGLMGFEPLEPKGVFVSKEDSFGSHAKNTQNYQAGEKFAVYLYDIPEHDTVIDGKEAKNFNNLDDLLGHKYNYSIDMTFYAFYGYSSGEVILDFHQPSKANLLVISNSFSNPLNELIAQYFNKTYILDLRNYETRLGKTFVLSDYLREHKINKTLILANPYFLTDAVSNRGLDL